jgi:hypothetical protein
MANGFSLASGIVMRQPLGMTCSRHDESKSGARNGG